ncbi:GNAT family N-acetyltransferase [Lederbergia wuyishanensis]|uniref:Ribosomal protein S18 acetylase RimI-like enzyme n=1 Tax=Lederbergia wuyishanensis TaxID=1347903 RepID=A0ABU0D5Q2_9BACI|nr:GNAT family N-acetyltransferase [Lederbergia wuyishanensis]MCJ8008331.1 GNAT family N-acetyltransferase [Lederbergia wuyishanensis]MDQ0343743.1 ribosomal protein S18 acetylase RimI-like enzyme [Lederbergia wuyishanensis]
MIRQAQKRDYQEAAVLIYDAIHDIAHALTGEKQKENVLEQLGNYFIQEKNRLSYRNCFVKTVDDIPVGIIVAYHGKDAYELDEPIRTHIEEKTGKEAYFDQEADETDFYLDTLSVNPQFGGKGFGTELIQSMTTYANEQGFATFSLNVEESNYKACKLYERLGFIYKKTITINHHLYHYLVKTLS